MPKLINIRVPGNKEKLISMLSDNDRVNEGAYVDESRGKPLMKLKINDNKIRITCEMTGRATRDNGFIVGTYFSGKIKEQDGVTTLKGVILTAPIYHLIIAALFAFFIFQCIRLGGISVYPIFIVLMDIVLFYGEFKKQSLIKNYIYRAARKVAKGI